MFQKYMENYFILRNILLGKENLSNEKKNEKNKIK
jgi:hypothetical protein